MHFNPAAKKRRKFFPRCAGVTVVVVRDDMVQAASDGLPAMGAINRDKAARRYGAIDGSGGFYRGRAAHADRSLMNVVFHLPTPALEERFRGEAEPAGFYGLEGNRSLSGGLRASLYNAVTPASVDALTDFMDDFQRRHG